MLFNVSLYIFAYLSVCPSAPCIIMFICLVLWTRLQRTTDQKTGKKHGSNYCNHQTSASLALNHVAAPSFLNRPLTFLTFWSQAEKVFCAHRTQISKYITLNWELADFSFKQKVWETQRRVRALWGKRIHETAFCLGFFSSSSHKD